MTGVTFASPTAPRGFMAGGRRSDGLLRSGAPNPEGMGSVPYYIPNWAYDNELNNPNNQHVGGGNPFKRVSTVMKHPAFSQLGRSKGLEIARTSSGLLLQPSFAFLPRFDFKRYTFQPRLDS